MPDFYTQYIPTITDGLVAGYDVGTLHSLLTDGQAVNQTLIDISGNGNHISPSALAITGLPIYHEADITVGTGRGPSYLPRLHMASKNCLITPVGVRLAIGSGDVTIIMVAVEPSYGASANYAMLGLCNGDAYRSGTGTINGTGSIGVNATWETGQLKLKRGSTQIGDYGQAPNATANVINKYKVIAFKRVSGVWYVSRDGLPFLPAFSVNSTDPVGSSPLLDLAFGYFGNNSFLANEDFLYGAIYSRGLSDAEIGTEVLSYSAQKMDCENIFPSGNSILLGQGLGVVDRPITYITAIYNELGTDTKVRFVIQDAVTGRPYQSMQHNYGLAQSQWGNLLSPIRGRCLVLVEEETNTLAQVPAGQDPIAWVHTQRENFIKQFYPLTHVTVGISSMKPRIGITETLRSAVYVDLCSHIATMNATYGNRFILIDSGSDSQIGVFSALTGPNYQTDETHLTAVGERILINGYYLPFISGWIAS